MIDENIRKKIQKLFTMAERGTGNEAEVALQKARLLMQEYGITENDAGLFIDDMPLKKRPQRWVRVLHELCGTFCGCVSLTSYMCLTLAGDEIGVSVGRELFLYLRNEIERKTALSPVFGQRQKNDFRIGIVLGLHKRMEECGGWRDMKEKRRAAIQKHYSKTKYHKLGKRYVENFDFIDAGKKMAQEINISRQAGAGSAAGYLTGGKE